MKCTTFSLFSLIMVALTLVESNQGCSNDNWQLYKAQFRKSYISPNEEIQRQIIFCENLKQITEHNERYLQGEETWEMGLNQFADWTHREFLEWVHGQRRI